MQRKLIESLLKRRQIMKTIVTRQAFSHPGAILTKTALILTAALILTFASCKQDDDDGSTIVSNAPVDYTGASSAARQQTNFSFYLDDSGIIPLKDLINEPASVTIKNSKVNINLGIPKDLIRISMVISGVIATPNDAKMSINNFGSFYTSDGKYMLSCIKNYYPAYLMYADKDVNIKSTGDVSFDMNLKQGWNYVFGSEYSLTITASTTLPSGYKWTVSDVAESGTEAGILTVNGLPEGYYIVIVFNSGTDVSTSIAITAAMTRSIQAIGYSTSSDNSFELMNMTTSKGWAGTGSFPVVLYSSGDLTTEFKSATVYFANGTATVNYSFFKDVNP